MKTILALLLLVCLLTGCNNRSSSVTIQILEGYPPTPSRAVAFSYVFQHETFLRQIVRQSDIANRLSMSEAEAIEMLQSRTKIVTGETQDILHIFVKGLAEPDRDYILKTISQAIQKEVERLLVGEPPDMKPRYTVKILD